MEAEAAHPGLSFDRLSSNTVFERVLELDHLLQPHGLLRGSRARRSNGRSIQRHWGSVGGRVHAGAASRRQSHDRLLEDDTQHLAGALLARIELHELNEVIAYSLGEIKGVEFVITEFEGKDWERNHGENGYVGQVVAGEDGPESRLGSSNSSITIGCGLLA